METNLYVESLIRPAQEEKRTVKEIAVMWNQLKSLCFAVLLYAGVSAIWGQKIMFVFGGMAVGIIIYRLNKI